MKIDKVDELVALQKAITFVKFECEDYDARYLATSPLYGKLLQRINDELSFYYHENNILHSKEYGDIINHPEYLKKVNVHISNIDNWMNISKTLQIEIIKDLCAPFSINEMLIDDILSGQ